MFILSLIKYVDNIWKNIIDIFLEKKFSIENITGLYIFSKTHSYLFCMIHNTSCISHIKKRFLIKLFKNLHKLKGMCGNLYASI